MSLFNVHNMAVVIIDTYENERSLIEELSAKDSIVLSYEGDDDIFFPIMSSEIKFTMAVTDKTDGKFLHLLTGDEKRYMVQLLNIDEEENEIIIWQGYILPDLYKEPYKGGVIFVEFTAIDMIASLKGKFFKPWYYYNKFNLPKLLAEIFSETGIEQQMMVKPMLVNTWVGFAWSNLNIDLSVYYNGDEYTDMYDILTDILTANGLTLFSFYGYWFIQGFSRRVEFSGPAELYNADGTYNSTVSFENDVISPMHVNDTVDVTALTPFKKVNINFNTEDVVNLFSEDVVVDPASSTMYNFATSSPNFTNGYLDMLNNQWIKTGVTQCTWDGKTKYYFSYRKATTLPSADYNFPESAASVNYFECRQKPYAAPGRLYELEMEIDVVQFFSGDPDSDWVDAKLKDGSFDRLVVFQMFINNNELVSNRPSHPASTTCQFEKVNGGAAGGSAYDITYKLKWYFEVPEPGQIVFRFLPPIDKIIDYEVTSFFIYPRVLKINVVEEIQDVESAIAVRDVNYTQELDIDVNLTCTVDSGVNNSMGISPILDPRFETISTTGSGEIIQEQFVKWLTGTTYDMVELGLTRWPITETLQDLIFRADKNQSLFVEKATGESFRYNSVYTKTEAGFNYIAALNTITPPNPGIKAKLPEGYDEMPALEAGDVLKVMKSTQLTENLSNRAGWKIYGLDDITAQPFTKTYAYACHCLRPQQAFRIESSVFALVFPINLLQFRYIDYKIFLPTRLTINLTGGKTDVTMSEAMFTELNDVTYD